MLPSLLVLSLALTPSLVSGALFPSNSLVKWLDGKDFKKALKANQTSVVAFVAPWCGHCQRMAPEYSKAALGLYPLIPTYAVDCDAQKNRAICAEQGVQGFPTIKLFPRGIDSKPVLFDGEQRTASAFYYWATRRIPHKVKKLYHTEDIAPWVQQHKGSHRILLLNKGKAMPMLWEVLGNKYRGQLEFGHNRDRKGKTALSLGFPKGAPKESRVLVFPAGDDKPLLYQGVLKLEPLSTFIDSLLAGTADLGALNAALASEDAALTPEEEEIAAQQDAQRIALAHGGFGDMIDFEEAVKKYGKDFHGAHGGAGGPLGMMGEPPKRGEGKGKEEDPIHRILKAQKEKAEREASASRETTPKTGDGGQIVMEVPTDTPHSATATAAATATESASAEPTAAASPVEEEGAGTTSASPVEEEPAPSASSADEEGAFASSVEEPTAASSVEEAPTPTPATEPEGAENGHVKDEL